MSNLTMPPANTTTPQPPPPPPPYVREAADNVLVVVSADATLLRRLAERGVRYRAAAGSDPLRIDAADDADKGRLMQILRDLGVAFSRGREWSPAEVFEWLRDKKLAAGPFRSIAWRGPGDWFCRNEP